MGFETFLAEYNKTPFAKRKQIFAEILLQPDNVWYLILPGSRDFWGQDWPEIEIPGSYQKGLGSLFQFMNLVNLI